MKAVIEFYQNPFGQLLLQEIGRSNMGISELCVYQSEEARNRRKQYAVDYICQLSKDNIVSEGENEWCMDYHQMVDNFAEFWSKKLIGHWMIRQRGNDYKQPQKRDYQLIHEKFIGVFQKEMEDESKRGTTRKGNAKMALTFEGIGYMSELHLMHAIEKAAAIVDLTVRLG